MKDIIMALCWVKENIECFGGDPNNITLCGNSSAATNIHLIMISPLAKGICNAQLYHGQASYTKWPSITISVEKLMFNSFFTPFHRVVQQGHTSRWVRVESSMVLPGEPSRTSRWIGPSIGVQRKSHETFTTILETITSWGYSRGTE